MIFRVPIVAAQRVQSVRRFMGDQPERASTSHALRVQESEFYEWVMALLASMPPGTTVAEAMASREGQRLRQKWTLKHGRRPPL